MQTNKPEQWAVELWAEARRRHEMAKRSLEFSNRELEGIAALTIQRAFEERERKLRDRHLADLGEALDHLLQDVELEDALTAVGIGVYGPDATKFEKMFAAAMKCRERFAALKDTHDAQ